MTGLQISGLLATLLPLAIGVPLIWWERRKLARTLARIEPWQLYNDADRLWYVMTHRRYMLTMRFDPFEETV